MIYMQLLRTIVGLYVQLKDEVSANNNNVCARHRRKVRYRLQGISCCFECLYILAYTVYGMFAEIVGLPVFDVRASESLY